MATLRRGHLNPMQPVVLFLTNTRCSIAHCPDSLLDLIDSRTAYLHNEGTDTRAKPSEYNVVDREVEWDGYVRFLRRGQKTMWPWVPLGLRDIVAWTLYEAQVPYEVQDSRTAPEPYPEFVQRYSTPIPLRPHQEACKAAMLESYDCAAVMPPRCFHPDTEVVLYSGRRVPVSELQEGDLLPGPDGTPRTVRSLHHGEGPLFRVRRTYAEDLVVNRGHLLPIQYAERIQKAGVRETRWVHRLVSVEDYLDWSADRKRKSRLYRAPVAFEERALPSLSPYLLGVLLGNGSLRKSVSVATSDPELIAALQYEAASHGVGCHPVESKRCPSWYLTTSAGAPNPLLDVLDTLGLRGHTARTKFVPSVYKTSSLEARLDLLAGLFDCDADAEGEWLTASSRLRDDIQEVVQSVGLRFSYGLKRVAGYDHDYWRCRVMGDVSRIPHRVTRKRRGDCSRFQNGEKFDVLPAEVGPFIGFELDGDRHFVMPDGTVQHNSGKTRTLFEVVRTLALPTLWVAPTTNIVDQTISAAHEFFEPFDAVQVTSKTQYDVKDALLTVCTAGALPTLNKDFLESRHHLVSDEVHHFLAQKAWGSTLLEHTPHIAHRKGMTGTFFRSNGDDLALHAYVSRIAYQVQSKELEEKGYLVPCYSTFVGLKGPRVQAGRGRAFNAPDGHGTKGIQNHSFRNDVVASVAKHLTDTGRRVLVLVWTKKQGNLILDRLRPFFPPSGPMQKLEPVEFVSTNRHKQAIREILEDFRSHGTVKVLIGTSMIGEGTDLPPADALVYAAGGKAKVQLTQAWYRVITKTEDKQYAVIVDFTDEHHPKLRDHARQRWGVMAQDPIFRMSHCPDLPAFQAWCQHLAPWSPEG